MLYVLLLVISFLQSPAPSSAPPRRPEAGPAGKDEKPIPRPPRPTSIPDPTWRPRPGDIVEAHSLNDQAVFGAEYASGYEDLLKFRVAKDRAGLDAMEVAGHMARIPNGTTVRLIELSDYRFDKYRNRLAEIRVVDGRFGDRKFFVLLDDLARMVTPTPEQLLGFPIPAAKAAKKAATHKPIPPRPVDPAARAATILQAGKNLQFDGNHAAALENYRRVVREFPASPSAREAADLIKKIGG